jgi:hypothetical protein
MHLSEESDTQALDSMVSRTKQSKKPGSGGSPLRG